MKCTEAGCKKAAFCNVAGGERKYCKDHKKDGMVEVPKHRCKEDGCNEAALYNFKRGVGGKLCEYCKLHNTEHLATPLKGEEGVEEIWKEIPGYEGYYWASNLGNIKSRYKIIKGDVKKTGHTHVKLSRDGCGFEYLVHRLVADAFIERVEGKNVVDHIDRDPRNNAASNLRWVTHRENCWNQNARANKTGYKHVTKVGNKYQAIIARNIGSYDTAEEAHEAATNYLKHFDESYKKYAHLGYNPNAYKKEEIKQ
jgi:hypothetical protein